MECETSFSYVYSSGPSWITNKRKRYENGTSACKDDVKGPAKTRVTCFIQMLPNKGIFQSEKWKPNGSTLYYPVTSHLLVNFEKYDQISLDEGLFFIGDDSGGCVQKEQDSAKQDKNVLQTGLNASVIFSGLLHQRSRTMEMTSVDVDMSLKGLSHFSHVIHCWRFDDKEKTLFIAMSYLFTDFSTFQEIVSQLN